MNTPRLPMPARVTLAALLILIACGAIVDEWLRPLSKEPPAF